MAISVQPRPRVTPTPPPLMTDNPYTSTSTAVANSKKPDLKSALADKQNLITLGIALNKLAKQLGENASAPAILAALNATSMVIHPDTRSPQDAGNRVPLEAFISSLGLPLPDSHFALTGLATAVTDRGQVHPLGNMTGALSWLVPPSADDKRRIRLITMNHGDPHGQYPLVMQTNGLLLEFLRSRTALPAGALKDPATARDALLSSPEGQLLGETLQKTMRGVATDSSTMDYLLAAVILQLDPESITQTRRNMVAGFDMMSDKHWGKPMSTVLKSFEQHLVTEKRTSAAMAGVASSVLLPSRVAAFGIKDIPASVTYGSPAWAEVSIIAAIIEGLTPGKVANMTFAEVMLAASSVIAADPALTQRAQREALVDWGVINGVLPKKDDHLYSADELDTLLLEFNTRKALTSTANQALDADIPSRKEMALIELKKRFPGQEALFDQKLIHISRRETTASGDVGYRTVEVGPHSMLDIAMMKLPQVDLVFTSNDVRVPLAALTATPHFGVADAFEPLFTHAIQEKKAAINTYIKHLISQAPLEVREDLEYGKISFFQEHSRTLGPGFTGSTPRPKNEELLVRVERNGITKVYAISFNRGTIDAVDSSRATPRSHREANVVHDTKAFTPTGDDATRRAEQKRPNQRPPNSFGSERTGLIANAFVQHVDLDDDAIKQEARGLTTADSNYRRGEAVTGFILDLIPFRSAINNFRKGDIGAGLFDLAIDLFGIVTAGAGIGGKVVKIAGSGVSAATKVARSAKVIGTATISALNPLDGVGDLAVGVWKGANAVSTGLKRMSGIKARPDLIAASRHFDAASIGTFTRKDDILESQAVLINDQWYAYNPTTRQPYGSPLENFVPSAHMEAQNMGKWATSGDSAKTIDEDTFKRWTSSVVRHRTGPEASAFEAGYNAGDLRSIKGISKSSSIADLIIRGSDKSLTAEQVGILVRRYDDLAYELGRIGSARFIDNLEPRFGTVTPIPQVLYFSLTKQLSDGECAALARVMATAVEEGKELELIRNMYRAAALPKDAASIMFMKKLRKLQLQVGSKTAFHASMTTRQLTYQNMVKELSDSTVSKSIMIDSPGHAMAAGVKVNGDKKVFYFYDPNFGYATFSSADAMQGGLTRLFNDRKLVPQYRTHGTDQNSLEFIVFDHNDDWQKKNSVFRSDIEELYNAPIATGPLPPA